MLHVVCAIIRNPQGEIFAARRSATMPLPLKWEFPGGKIDEGEDAESALLREIREELGVSLRIVRQLAPTEHHYPGLTVRLIPFVAEISEGAIALAEHVEGRWLAVDDLDTVDWAAADVPVVNEVKSVFCGR